MGRLEGAAFQSHCFDLYVHRCLRAFVSGGAGHRDDGERDLLGRKALAFAEREVEEEEGLLFFFFCWRTPRAALSRSSSTRPVPSSMLEGGGGGEGGVGRLDEIAGSSMLAIASCGVGAGAVAALLEAP